MFAPKPLGLTAADDWTVEIETKGFPDLKALYTLLGERQSPPEAHLQFPHNYNYVCRKAIPFMNQHLGLDIPMSHRNATINIRAVNSLPSGMTPIRHQWWRGIRGKLLQSWSNDRS